MLFENSRYYLTENQAAPYVSHVTVSPEMPETLGELIRRRMKDLDIRSKSELARMIGKSSAYVGDLTNDTAKTRNGRYRPGDDVIQKLADVLEVPINDVLAAIGLPITGTGASHDILDKARVSFLDESFTPEERDRILDMMRTLVAGAIAGKSRDADER